MWLEDVKAAAERLTGIGRPDKVVPRARKPHAFFFRDDGKTPNNPRFPMILYRSPVRLDPGFDPAALFEDLFAANGWGKGWRDGIYPFNHFHTATHEVLGIARGHARVRFGGRKGRVIEVRERAAARAAAKGLDADLVRQLYTILIDYSCNLEEVIKGELRDGKAT